MTICIKFVLCCQEYKYNIVYLVRQNYMFTLSTNLINRWKMKHTYKTILLFIISFSAHSEIDLKFNFMGEFVPPGKILQERGLRDYKNGNLNSSFKNFKRSAKFGNEMSKYLIALLYFEKKDWVTGYAWLNMVKEPIDQRDQLIKKFNAQLTKKELAISHDKLSQLQQEYSKMNIYDRRVKWQRKIRLTGTNIPGLQRIGSKALSIDAGGLDRGLLGKNTAKSKDNADGGSHGIIRPVTTSNNLKRSIRNYVLEYAPQGEVIMGDIIEKDG